MLDLLKIVFNLDRSTHVKPADRYEKYTKQYRMDAKVVWTDVKDKKYIYVDGVPYVQYGKEIPMAEDVSKHEAIARCTNRTTYEGDGIVFDQRDEGLFYKYIPDPNI